ncbi:MAG: hypothetical protein ACKOWW_07310 [Flavobacteriales bacterium]
MGPLIYRWILIITTISFTGYFIFLGYGFYNTPLDQRFYHADYQNLRASGPLGHGLGIYGTLLISIGVFGYIYAKKTLRFEKYVRLKYLLEFHIFLCTLGPIMILFHTTFKFGGIVSIGFWSMVLVVLSGVVGRYIYIQIPRKLNGKELDAEELANELAKLWKPLIELETSGFQFRELYLEFDKAPLRDKSKVVSKLLLVLKKEETIPKLQFQLLQKNLRQLQIMSYRVARLDRMRRLFKYWHVVHKPFAIIMLVIVIVHVTVAVMMGYTYF